MFARMASFASFTLVAALTTLSAVEASAQAARIDVLCQSANKSLKVQFGFSRYTQDFWGESLVYGPTLGSRVQDVDVGQFANDDGAVYLKFYTPESTPAAFDLSGYKLRLKRDGAKYSGTLRAFFVSYETTKETLGSVVDVTCRQK